nr:hypothetical protein [Tanacetum cinerariifolium]
MEVEKSLNMTFDESLPPPKTTPLVDDDLVKKKLLRNKLDENGVLSRNKARLVAQGYNQQEGIDYDETFGTAFRLHPYQFTYPERRLTMKEMLYKFIDKGKQKHEEMSAFINEFRTTNKLLFKERNNSPSELLFKVYGLSKVINNALISKCEGKGVTTRGGKTKTQGILNDNTDIHDKEPSVFIHDKLDAPKEVLVENEPQKAKEQVVQPSIKENVVWVMQRTYNFSKMYDHNFPQHGGRLYGKIENISSRSEMPQNNIQVEAQALPMNDAHVVIKLLMGLFARFGVPKALINNQGTHFCNFQLEKALRKYEMTHKLSTAYHPQTNGQTKVTNRAIKCILERSVGYNLKDWFEKLNDAL